MTNNFLKAYQEMSSYLWAEVNFLLQHLYEDSSDITMYSLCYHIPVISTDSRSDHKKLMTL